jgi:hypothetical protein
VSGVARGGRDGRGVSGTASPPVRADARARGVACRVRRGSGRVRRWSGWVRRWSSWVRRWYGANPLHLLALLAAFALAGYAVHAVMAAGQWTGFAAWFAVAIIGHDLLLFPLYSLADLSLRHLLPGGSHGRLPEVKPATRGPFEPARPAVAPPAIARPAAAAAAPPAAVAQVWPPLLNYVRIPVIFSLLLLLTFFPVILGLSAPELHRASGLGTGPYVWRWLGVTGAMFAISAVTYALRTRRAGRRGR